MYLNDPLPSPEFVRFRADTILVEIWEQYGLDDYKVNGWIYARGNKGMYGLPQAGKVASNHLLPCLKVAGYEEAGQTAGLFRHKHNGTIFVLVVDDFLVHHLSAQALQHLINTLQEHYTITVDPLATKFCGMTLAWNYTKGHVTPSIPGYVQKALHPFMHPAPSKSQQAPHPWTPPDYGARIQYATPEDTS